MQTPYFERRKILYDIYLGQSTVLNLFWEIPFHFETDLYISIQFLIYSIQILYITNGKSGLI